MAVQEVKIIEERCDRCKVLFATRKIGEDGTAKRRKIFADVKGPFSVYADNKKRPLLHYENICMSCRKRLDRLIGMMGQVDKTSGGRRPKEK
jgi:hypothetical protein